MSSDKGTVHVFKLTIGERSAVAMAAAATNGTAAGGMANPVSPLSFVSVRSASLWPPAIFASRFQALHVCVRSAGDLCASRIACRTLLACDAGEPCVFLKPQSILPVPYFASERSFAQFRLPEDVRSIVAFGTVPSTLVVVSASGAFYSASFDTDKGGACQQHSFARFIESDSDS